MPLGEADTESVEERKSGEPVDHHQHVRKLSSTIQNKVHGEVNLLIIFAITAGDHTLRGQNNGRQVSGETSQGLETGEEEYFQRRVQIGNGQRSAGQQARMKRYGASAPSDLFILHCRSGGIRLP